MTTGAGSLSDRLSRARGILGDLAPGIMVSVILAIAAKFMSEHYGAPAMLMALLLGIALQFLSEEGRCASGIAFSAKTLLRVGVALLGARISADILIGLGPELIALVILGSVATILFGLVCARLLGRGWRLALLTGGSVAICGASAAMAIAAVLPRNEHSERNLSFTILSVTVLSTVAMMVYPVLSEVFDLDARTAGVFLGGTIHDVAQVVGAGFSISTETGDIATLVKLIRVTMLAPVVLVFALVVRGAGLETPDGGKRPPLIPIFVLAFLGFALLSTLGAIPAAGVAALGDLSRWALLTAIAAVGMKTSLRRIREVGGQAVALIVAETIFIGGFILGGVHVLGAAGG